MQAILYTNARTGIVTEARVGTGTHTGMDTREHYRPSPLLILHPNMSSNPYPDPFAPNCGGQLYCCLAVTKSGAEPTRKVVSVS